MPLFGEPDVQKLKAKGDVRGLIKAMSRQMKAKRDVKSILRAERYERARMAAAEALGSVKDARAVEPLIAALSDRSAGLQQAAAAALGKLDDARAVEPLIAALSRSSAGLQQAAAAALGKLNDARAVGPLVAVLRYREKTVRRAAAEALDRLGWKPDQDETGVTYWIAKEDWNACVAIGARAVAHLIVSLECDRDGSVRCALAEALGRTGDTRAVDALVAALGDGDKGVRDAAAEALGEIGDARAVDALIAALEHRYGNVRSAAAEALGRIGHARAVEPLIAAIKKSMGPVRIVGDDDYKKTASRALARLGALAVEPLIDAYLKGDVCVGGWLFEGALLAIGTPAVTPLVAKLQDRDSRVRWRATLLLAELGDHRAFEPLVTALADEHRVFGAVEYLGKLGDARAIEPLAAALKHSDMNVRRAAGNALRHLKKIDGSAASTIEEELGEWEGEWERELREWEKKRESELKVTRSARDLWSECLDMPS